MRMELYREALYILTTLRETTCTRSMRVTTTSPAVVIWPSKPVSCGCHTTRTAPRLCPRLSTSPDSLARPRVDLIPGLSRQSRGSPAHPARPSYLRSVSYTHLRAHETPEHLVCRLLLEKK